MNNGVFANEHIRRLLAHYQCHPSYKSRASSPKPEWMTDADHQYYTQDTVSAPYRLDPAEDCDYRLLLERFFEAIELPQMRYDNTRQTCTAPASLEDIMRVLCNTAYTLLRYMSQCTKQTGAYDMQHVALVFRAVFLLEFSESTFCDPFMGDYMLYILRHVRKLLHSLRSDVGDNVLALNQFFDWRICGPTSNTFCDIVATWSARLCREYPAHLGYLGDKYVASASQMLCLHITVAMAPLLTKQRQSVVAAVVMLLVLENTWTRDMGCDSRVGMSLFGWLAHQWTPAHEKLACDIVSDALHNMWEVAKRNASSADKSLVAAGMYQSFHQWTSTKRPPHHFLLTPSPLNFGGMCRLLVKWRFPNNASLSTTSLLASDDEA